MSRANSDDKTVKQEIGRRGEQIAAHFLEERRFRIIGRNYKDRGFEIDIIARKKGVLHFFEVKTVLLPSRKFDPYRHILPSENIDKKKIRKIRRGVKLFLDENNFSPEKTKWQIDFIGIKIHSLEKKAVVEKYEKLAANY